jgi:hypothetical protein
MNHIWTSFRHHSLFTAVAVVALAQSAFADDGPRALRAVDAVVTPDDEEALFDAALPLHLDSWAVKTDESDLKEAHAISLELFPQGRMSSKPPFIDFSRLEFGAFAGAVHYSADFKAHLSYIFGVTSRVPVPGLGKFGLWAEAFLGYIDRNLPFYYNSQAGNWFGAAIGADYTIVKGELGYIRAQVGVDYIYWHNINSLDNGLGIVAGFQIGVFWIRNNDRTSITFNPQFHFDGSDHMIFLPIGFSVDF